MTNTFKRYHPWILAAVSALLLLLSFPTFNLYPCAWIALIPFFIAITHATPWKTTFWISYLTGVLFFAVLLLAILLLYPYANIFATALAYISLVGYTGLYFAIFAILMRFVPKHSTLLYTLAAAALWTTLEWVRSWMITGFPWGSIGYSQWNNPIGIQIADLVGVHGISFIIVLFNASIALLITNRHQWRQELRVLVLPLILTIFCFGYGFIKLQAAAPLKQEQTGQPALKVALIPGNIPQLQKWDARELPKILQRYIALTREASRHDPDVLVWPETAIRSEVLTGQWPTYYTRFARMLREVNRPLLIGTATTGDAVDPSIGAYPRKQAEPNIYNRVLSITPDGNILGAYAKIHLVPFGEYVPLTDFLPDLIQFKPFTPGKTVNLLPITNVKDKDKTDSEPVELGISICFESVFPDEFRQPVKMGARAMGIFTNDAWFKGTAFPELHLSMAPYRAIENRIGVFRCANGGFTCLVDKYGRITTPRITEETAAETLIAAVPLLTDEHKRTLYTRYGDWFPILCTLICIGGFATRGIIARRRKNV